MIFLITKKWSANYMITKCTVAESNYKGQHSIAKSYLTFL